jgi:DNA-binding XRE family transcriptional regulator
MKRYKLVAKAHIVGHVEANNEAEALMKYHAGDYHPAEKNTKYVVAADLVDDIAITLIEYRKWSKKTQKEVAMMLGVNKITIIRWEHGRAKPSRLAIDRLKKEGIL